MRKIGKPLRKIENLKAVTESKKMRQRKRKAVEEIRKPFKKIFLDFSEFEKPLKKIKFWRRKIPIFP